MAEVRGVDETTSWHTKHRCRHRALVWGLVAAALVPFPAAADDTPQQTLATGLTPLAADSITLELIMSDPDWIGNPPTDAYWADDSQAIYYEQKRTGEEHNDLIRIDLDTNERTVVTDQERGLVDVREGRLSLDRKLKTYTRQGDVYVKDLATGTLTQLTRNAADETDASFMADSRRVLFRRDDAIFVRDLETGLESQPADLRLSKDPAEEDDQDGFLAEQQMRLFEILQQRKQDRDLERELQRREQLMDLTRPPLPFYLGEEVEVVGATLSPAGDALVLVVADKKRELGRKDQMANWVTRSGYVEALDVRPKVGTARQVGQRLMVLDLETHDVHELDLSALPGITDDPLAELRDRAQQAKKEKAGEGAEETSEDLDSETPDKADEDAEPTPREVTCELPPVWSPDGQQLAIQVHSYDNKDRWLALFDNTSQRLEPIHRLTHEAWINWSFNEFGWLSDSRRLFFLSEESGYSQLYLYSLGDGSPGGGTTRRLTDGDYVVSDVVPSPDEKYFYYSANPDHPGIYETYRVAVDSGKIEQLTGFGGRSSFVLSPDGDSLLIRASSTTHPPELHVQSARPGAEPRQLTDTVSERFSALPWVKPQIVAVPSSHHSRPIYSRYYPPQGPAPAAGRPAVVFVHGAGYLQNAHQGWSGYFREFMFHTFLTQHGYAVLDMDYRASAGYGAEWRTAIYRQMGTPELEDLQDGVAWLTSEQGVDEQRIGVYGGSYGGFMALMALFKQPDLFACGAALRPVTDWAHYNHPYTSNILNTPDIDPEAYQHSSPIEHAEGLEKPLLICAPMQDDNVFFQDTVRLTQRLIELEKEDWEVAIFPIEPHGFREPSSWLNEYRRIFKLFETHLGP